jgi:hypothetical protein
MITILISIVILLLIWYLFAGRGFSAKENYCASNDWKTCRHAEECEWKGCIANPNNGQPTFCAGLIQQEECVNDKNCHWNGCIEKTNSL